MQRKTYETKCGTIVYWTNRFVPDRRTLVFLPGLTADHRLFDKQLAYFGCNYNVLVWDAPGHAQSRPFKFEFSLEDKAKWLHDILQIEGVSSPVLIGQSMGGYVSQAYMQLFPSEVGGFVSIDSAPLQREYMAGWEIWSLKHVESVYRLYPWKRLLKDGSRGCAESEYGRTLMRQMMETYTGEKDDYCRLSGHGFRILAEAVEKDLPYKVSCPAILVCGERDKAGSAKRYNREWAKRTGLPIFWIEGAGHNANTDKPDAVNQIITQLVERLPEI